MTTRHGVVIVHHLWVVTENSPVSSLKVSAGSADVTPEQPPGPTGDAPSPSRWPPARGRPEPGTDQGPGPAGGWEGTAGLRGCGQRGLRAPSCRRLVAARRVPATSDVGPPAGLGHKGGRAEGGRGCWRGQSCGAAAARPTPGSRVMRDAWEPLTKVKHHLLFRATRDLENKRWGPDTPSSV